jgi:kynurenine formamidase
MSHRVSRGLAAVALGVLLVAGLLGGRPRPAAGSGAAGPLPGFGRVVFLSHVNDPARTPVFPGDPAFTLTTVFTVPEDGFYLQYLREGEHTGTHYSAPCHFHQGERCADQLAAADFVRPAVVVDVRRQAASDADYEVSVTDLRRFERRHGRIPRGAAVIAWTGWQDRWGTPAYLNYDAQGNVHQPGFSLAAARWLLRERGLGAIGTDTFSPEAATDTEFRVSSLVLHGHRMTLENLAGLQQMPPTGGFLVVGGPRNRAGSGAPSTILGLVP